MISLDLLGLSLNFVTSVCDNRQVRLLYPETRADVAAFPEDVAEHVKDAMLSHRETLVKRVQSLKLKQSELAQLAELY